MTFLSKFAQIALKVTQIVLGFAPIAGALDPAHAGLIQTVSLDLQRLAQIIAEVEIIGQTLALPGPLKLQAATPLVAQVILQSSMMTGHKIQDEVKFRAGCQKIADGMADVLNSLHDSGVDSTNKA